MNQIKLMCLASAASRVTPLRASRSGRSAKLDKLLGNEVMFEYIFDAFPAKGIAERLTLLGASIERFINLTLPSEWEIFLRIRPSELLGTAWQSEQKHETAPNVVALIEHFNRVVGWVATEIVRCALPTTRL